MNVYLLTNGEYSYCRTVGVFLSPEEAMSQVPDAEWVDITKGGESVYPRRWWSAHDPAEGEYRQIQTACRVVHLTKYNRDGWRGPMIEEFEVGVLGEVDL